MSTIQITGELQRGELDLQLDVEIPPGLTTITGPNGAGKTSLLRLIAGLEQLDRGHLAIDDTIVDNAGTVMVPPHQRSVAFVFQEHRLFPHLTAADNVAFALRRRGAKRGSARREACELLGELGLADLSTARPAALSVGQQQRVALARALAQPAGILLLDEPLAALDEGTRDLIRTLLRSVTHRTVLWVTHDPEDAAAGDRRMVLTDGSIEQT